MVEDDWTLDDFRQVYRVTEPADGDDEPYRIQSGPLIDRINWIADHFSGHGGVPGEEPVTLEPAEETYTRYHGLTGVHDGDELIFYSNLTADQYNEMVFGGAEMASDGDYVYLDDDTAVRLSIQYDTYRPATFSEAYSPVPEGFTVRMPTYTAVMQHNCTVQRK